MTLERLGMTGLIVDTNLLVLYVVGSVNRRRIESFKRTRQYLASDYDLLVGILGDFNPLYSVAHVLAEVSNLTDLSGDERMHARRILKETISRLTEVEMPSAQASQDPAYEELGLADAAISTAARIHSCTVLTDDLGLYLRLQRSGVNVLNFAHIRAATLC